MRERMTIAEIKINDTETRLGLLLRAKKGGKRSVSPTGGNEEDNQGGSGIDIAEIIGLLDEVKSDLRKELANKLEH
jgi:hypothetical protein